MKIATFGIACKFFGLDPKKITPDFSMVPVKHRAALEAKFKLDIIYDAAREGNDPDWQDRNSDKYTAVFDLEKDKNNPTGFRFYFATCDNSVSYAGAGSRLCTYNEEDLIYLVKKHEKLHRALMVIKK